MRSTPSFPMKIPRRKSPDREEDIFNGSPSVTRPTAETLMSLLDYANGALYRVRLRRILSPAPPASVGSQ